MKVNGFDAEPGCYIDGYWGQYTTDRLAELCEEFGIDIDDQDDPRFWRAAAEAETANDAALVRNRVGMGAHQSSPEECWDRHHWAADVCEERLNDHVEGGRFEWDDGELFLVADSEDDE